MGQRNGGWRGEGGGRMEVKRNDVRVPARNVNE